MIKKKEKNQQSSVYGYLLLTADLINVDPMNAAPSINLFLTPTNAFLFVRLFQRQVNLLPAQFSSQSQSSDTEIERSNFSVNHR